jgi:hypothetical protein
MVMRFLSLSLEHETKEVKVGGAHEIIAYIFRT